ncbi:MAG: DUF4012 domain-containing protein [Candidatus Moranbacteria bacterium]|jgi:hypothetical protein|nr:DUF4012 domain-containing protein [Candidatus Moranbacteria bacterium]MBP9801218.1 DUF4012 domain-containing protein [Candidatus Moranbacteria bacterium]
MDSIRKKLQTPAVPSRKEVSNRESLGVLSLSNSKVVAPSHSSLNQKTYQKPPATSRVHSRATQKGKKWKTWRVASLVGCLLLSYMVLAWWNTVKAVEAGNEGYIHIVEATHYFQKKNFESAHAEFEKANQQFYIADRALAVFPGRVLDTVRFIPGFSKPASGRNAVLALGYISRAGSQLSVLAGRVMPANVQEQQRALSLIEMLEMAQEPLVYSTTELEQARILLDRVNILDIPSERREKFLEAREIFPAALAALKAFHERERILVELLGGNGPRKYLFLFQNNHELRATGGFIGSYALLSVHDGALEKFFIDGIFNPDGQLKENIVPPKPIQKISAGWSLHDSNWYPDFPTSAEKAISFYEKTGGPTVDGVVTVTPTVMERLLSVLGPIDLPVYGVTIDSENFIQIVQEQVEEKYDKEENNPKKILSDLSLEVFSRIAKMHDYRELIQIAEVLVQGLNEKHILLYARHPATEDLIDHSGWSGKLLSTEKDFVSVVHSNINGYKTDGVIEESLSHRADIANDGSITDTLVIVRRHTGGQTPYEWWNKVNADYLRVYVPLGSELVSIKGTTWEFPEPPLDYDTLNFRRDPFVESLERNERIHEGSGTRIGEENGKTVFGAWVYVSPGESVNVELTYRLPWSFDMENLRRGGAERFSILYQKQSGTIGSKLKSEIAYPERWQSVWQTGGDLVPYGRRILFDGALKTDQFLGTAFTYEK